MREEQHLGQALGFRDEEKRSSPSCKDKKKLKTKKSTFTTSDRKIWVEGFNFATSVCFVRDCWR